MADELGKATQPLTELRTMIETARTGPQASRVQAMLIDVVEGLITHAEKQARLLEALRSDISHKQGIVTRIGGGDYTGPTPVLDPDKADQLDL